VCGSNLFNGTKYNMILPFKFPLPSLDRALKCFTTMGRMQLVSKTTATTIEHNNDDGPHRGILVPRLLIYCKVHQEGKSFSVFSSGTLTVETPLKMPNRLRVLFDEEFELS